MKNILHLSDLHFSTTDEVGFHIKNASKLIRSISEDVNEQNVKIDTIFVTGDISFSGKDHEFKSIKQNFIAPLLREFNLTENDLYIVPGNHDMDRAEVQTSEKITRKHSSEEDIKEVYEAINNNNESWKRLKNYQNFSNEIKNNQTNIIKDTPLIMVRSLEKNLTVHCINSAWLSCDDDDQGLLRILPLLSDTLTKCGKKNKNIVLMHHPLNWLHKDEINKISKLIEKNVDAVFYGHMHEFEQSVTINFNNDITLKLQAGTVDLRNQNSGYSLISLDAKNSFNYGKIFYRKYNDNKYEPWVDRIEQGFSDFSIDKHAIFDSSKFCDKSLKLLNDIEYSHLINIGKTEGKKLKLSDIFIPPKLEKKQALDSSLSDISESIYDVENILDIKHCNGCVLISATEQQGRTTLLKKIQLFYLEKQSKYDFEHIVFYIDLNHEYTNENKILNQFISNYEDSDMETSFSSKIKSCIKDGSAIFLIDNYDKCPEGSQILINKFISKYSANRFIITGEKENTIDNITKLVKVFKGNIYNASLCNIARCDIREIISRRPIQSPLHSNDELYNNLIKVVDSSQLPHNHFVYSILLAIYEEKHKLVGILNEADIIENYIELLLEKHCMIPNKDIPEYKILLHFLGFICSKLVFKKQLFIKEKELFQYILEFENLTMNEYPMENYIQPVLDSGIIVKNSNLTYEFSNICFLHFFSAYYMNTNEELKNYVFEEENYKYLDKIVEYYASINATTFDVLNFFEEKVKFSRKQINEKILNSNNINIEELNIDEIPTISLLDLASTSDEFEEKLNELNVDQNEYDKDLDKRVPLRGKKGNNKVIGNDHSNEVLNSHRDDVIELNLNYRNILSLFSKVFRNTELVMDPDEVMRIFDFIIDCYIFLIKSNVAILNESVVLPLLLPKFESEIAKGNIDSKDKDNLLNQLKVILLIFRSCVPNVVENLLSNNMATKKPRFTKILNNKLEIKSPDHMEELLIRFLLLDIERGKFKEHIEKLSKIKGKAEVGALFLKLMQLKLSRHDFKIEEKKYLDSKISDLVNNNRSGLNIKQISKIVKG